MERIHSVKELGFLVWIRTTPGPLNLQTSPSPEVMLENQSWDAFSIVYSM